MGGSLTPAKAREAKGKHNTHITQFMTARLFGPNAEAAKIINTERRHQGLLQIFYTCCNAEERNCGACYYLGRSHTD